MNNCHCNNNTLEFNDLTAQFELAFEGIVVGEKGDDGFSPIVEITRQTDGVLITITDATGAHSASLYDGAAGAQGQAGPAGADGVSPIVSITPDATGATISITDVTGTHSAHINNGQNGTDGIDGTDGADGITPTITTQAITGGNRLTVFYAADDPRNFTIDILNGEDGADAPGYFYTHPAYSTHFSLEADAGETLDNPWTNTDLLLTPLDPTKTYQISLNGGEFKDATMTETGMYRTLTTPNVEVKTRVNTAYFNRSTIEYDGVGDFTSIVIREVLDETYVDLITGYTAGDSLRGPQGPQGEAGDDYVLTAQDKSDIANLVYALLNNAATTSY